MTRNKKSKNAKKSKNSKNSSNSIHSGNPPVNEREQEKKELDTKIAIMEKEVADLHLRLIQERTKSADAELFIEGGALEPIKCGNFRLF